MYRNAQLSAVLASYLPSQIFVLADSQLSVDFPYPTMRIEATETHKTIVSAAQIWRFLASHNASRQAVLVNIGGGTICDLGGFAAATYMRGIDYVNVPTTLLAMVDAAIGGKTAVNLECDGSQQMLLKNYVGAFRQPKAVITDISFLQTLPAEEWLSGYGEVLKTSLLTASGAFAEVIETIEQSAAVEQHLRCSNVIEMCRDYKESIVAQDPEESGLRKVLNFGHTVGHALEEKTGAKHGYCVVWGMVAELYLSVVLCGCPRDILTQMSHIMLTNYGRPQCNCKQQSELVALMRKDKKNASAESINFTLLRNAGDPIINQVADESLINEALDYLFSL